MNITQRTVDQIVALAQNSAMGLGDPDKGRRSYDLNQYAEPHGAPELAMLLVSAHVAKWDLISLMTAALEVVGEGEKSPDSEPRHSPSAGSVAVVGEDGWRSAGAPPNTDRLVEIAWEDGSHGNPTLGFYDGIAEIPDSGRRWWWEWSKERGFHQITFDAVLAWRERHNVPVSDSPAQTAANTPRP